MTGEWAVVRTVDLGGGLSVTIAGGPARIIVEWRPGQPEIGKLTARQVAAYRSARNEVMREISLRRRGEQPLKI